MSSRILSRAACVLGLALVVSGIPAAAEGPVRIGVIDLQRILTDSAAGRAVVKQLDGLREQKQSTLDVDRQRLFELQREFDQKSASMDVAARDAKRIELEERAVALRRSEEDAGRQMQSRERELLAPLQDKVEAVIRDYSKEHGFTMVFDRFGTGLLFADPTVDITAGVVAKFDAAYAGD